MSWARAVDLMHGRDRDTLGLRVVESDTVWRYFQKTAKDHATIATAIDYRRDLEAKALQKMIDNGGVLINGQQV